MINICYLTNFITQVTIGPQTGSHYLVQGMNHPSIFSRLALSPWPYLAVRLVLAAAFVYAGAAKLGDPESFARLMGRYGLVPPGLLPAAAYGLPALEILAGLGLALDLRGSLALLSGMLAMFAAVLWFGVLSGLKVDCGCFSAADQAEHGGLFSALLRDLAMLAGAAYLYLWRARSPRRGGGRIRYHIKPSQGDLTCAK